MDAFKVYMVSWDNMHIATYSNKEDAEKLYNYLIEKYGQSTFEDHSVVCGFSSFEEKDSIEIDEINVNNRTLEEIKNC